VKWVESEDVASTCVCLSVCLQVLLHDAKDQPLMLERGFKVSPGFVTQVAVTPTYVSNVSSLQLCQLTISHVYTGWHKKLAQFFVRLNFIKYQPIYKINSLLESKICNYTITKKPTTPQVCCYTTLWNVTEWGKLLQHFIDHLIGQWRRRLECVV